MKLLLINKNNEVLDLLNNRDKFVLSAAEGLHGIQTSIAESETPYADGTTVESVKANPRGITFTFILRGNIQKSIDYFTSYVKSKQYITLRQIDGERDISIKGIATIPPYTRLEKLCKITLSVYCNQPYWEDIAYIAETISRYISVLHFPTNGQYFPVGGRPFGIVDTSLTKTINNKSDTTVGMLLSVVALGDVVNPQINCSTGSQNGWYMRLNVALKAEDILEINTVKGEKSIKINGVETYNGEPILNYLEWYGDDWLQLETGKNTFGVTTENGETNAYIHFSLTYKGRYE